MVDGVSEWGGCLVDQSYYQTRKYLEASDQLSGQALLYYLAGTFSV